MTHAEPSSTGSTALLESFVGRKDELSFLREWGQRGGKPLVVVGPPGVGKTSLVAIYSLQSRPDYARQITLTGQTFESANSISSFVTYHLRDSSGQPALVILDAFDEIVRNDEAGTFLRHVCKDQSEIRWLLTSRPSFFEALTLVEHLQVDRDYQALTLRNFNDAELAAYFEKRRLPPPAFEDFQRQALVERIDANPLLVKLIVDLVYADADLEKIASAVEGRLVRELRNLLIVPSHHDRLTAVPATQLDAQQLITPTGAVIPAAPYVIMRGLGRYWRQQLDEFEELLNDPGRAEVDYQQFFETYPHFLEGTRYERVIAHPVLQRDEEGGSLVPDFCLQPLGSEYADILDLKLPTEQFIVGRRDRLRFSSAVHEAAAQLREYRDYFEDPERRKRVMQKYGLTAYRPTLVVVIGRTPTFLGEEKMMQIRESLEHKVKVVTYDQLFLQMKRLVDMYSI